MSTSTTTGFTTIDTARAVGALQWATIRLFELLGGWVSIPDDPFSTVWLATASRHIGSHVPQLAEVMPDSELLVPVTVVAPASPELSDALDSMDTAARDAATEGLLLLATARDLIERLAADCDLVLELCASHCDGPLARAVTALGTDLSDGLAAADTVIGGVEVDPGHDPARVAPRFLPEVLRAADVADR